MKSVEEQKLLQTYGADTVIKTLEPYLTDNRKQRINAVLSSRLNSIQLAIETPCDINNALAAVRTCEALGISQIHIIAPEGSAAAARTITQGAIYWVTVNFYNSLADFLQMIERKQLSLAGGCPAANSISLNQVSINNPLCLFIGNERTGLSKAAMQACDTLYTIPMLGMSESLNLSVSAAISLYDTSQRRRKLLKQTGDLSASEQTALTAEFYLQSISLRLAKSLLSPNI